MSLFPHLFAQHSYSAWASRETGVGGGLAGGSCMHQSKWPARWLLPWPPQHPLPHTFLHKGYSRIKRTTNIMLAGEQRLRKVEDKPWGWPVSPPALMLHTGPPQATSTRCLQDSPPPLGPTHWGQILHHLSFLSWIFSLGVYYSWASQVSQW